MSAVLQWFDTRGSSPTDVSDRVDWLRVVPFVLLHLAPVAVVWVGVSPVAVMVSVLFYAIRMFAVTGFYHRYFAHRTFKAGRLSQFVFAVLGASATQRGPLWWAATHRAHHRFADGSRDPHTPRKGFWYAHLGWFLTRRHFTADRALIKDWLRFKELVWLDRFDTAVPLCAGCFMFGLGVVLDALWPDLGTGGWQMLVWGYVISTLILLHATLLVNSAGHLVGTRRFATEDDSRNWLPLALITLGEGWHNNHHRYPHAAQQGFFRGELDLSFLILKLLARLGVVWDLRVVPETVLREGASSGSRPRLDGTNVVERRSS
jgi:stearoyl-CoA desaturase (delta-9 desaturase)